MDGRINQEQLTRFVRHRDKRLRPEVDSSQLNYFLLDILLAEFADAKFILTIRDCHSWLESFINHQLARKSGPPSGTGCGTSVSEPAQFQHSEEERVLKEHGLYTLDGYLSYWADHNATVLQEIPSDKLLVIRTNEITKSTREIAAFAGIALSKISPEKSHSFKAAAKYKMLSKNSS